MHDFQKRIIIETNLLYDNLSPWLTGEHMCKENPNPKAFLDNMKKTVPLVRKLWLIARNFAIKITKLQSCCGHPGEPGC